MARERSSSKPVRFGPYALIGRLGEGGMCHVFRAIRKGDERELALKMLKEDFKNDERVRDLFITEADLSRLLKHPNLIRTVDAGEVSGRYYIAMELIEGATLREVADQCERIGVFMPPDFTMFVVSEVLEGLEAVHNATGASGRELGLVHRDVTPSNVFIGFDGRVTLGDFGIALIEAYGEALPGQAVGKLGYLAPEAASGAAIDRRADLFSVGVMLWELLTGVPLFAGGTDEQIIDKIAEAEVRRPRKLRPGIAKELEALVMKALAKKPKDRWQTAEEMTYALDPCWSPAIGNPRALMSFMAGLFREDARRWRERQSSHT